MEGKSHREEKEREKTAFGFHHGIINLSRLLSIIGRFGFLGDFVRKLWNKIRSVNESLKVALISKQKTGLPQSSL